ncbi:cytochrome P450 [Nakamurella sp. GG22]
MNSTAPPTTAPGERTLEPPTPKGPRRSVRSALLRAIAGDLPEFARDRLTFLPAVALERGPLALMRFGVLRVALLSDPQLIDEVLVRRNKEFGKHYLPSVGGALLGNGLFTSSGDFWKRERRLAQPAFHKSRLATYGDVMVRYAAQEAAGWRDGETRDLGEDMMRLTLRIVGRTLFGADVTGDAAALGRDMEVVRLCFVAKLNAIQPMPEWLPTPTNRRLRRAVRNMDRMVLRVAGERRASGEDAGDLLSMLLAAQDDSGAGMTDRQLRDELMTLFVGGHETTAIALSWTWHLLGNHPEVLAEVNAELANVLDGRLPSAADVPRLVVLERVLRESMRLYPPVYAFDRKALADLELGGRQLRKGTVILISPWVLHRRPELFEDPERFRPDRWLDPVLRRDKAYLPFGGGPRVCIGNGFAWMEMTLVMAAMLQQVSCEPVSMADVAADPSITLRPRGGLPMIVRRRTG